jgi:hypothetical protein
MMKAGLTTLPLLLALVACVAPVQAQYVPAPQAATTNYLVGANYFGGWNTAECAGAGWERISPHASRTPTLGYYNEGSPEVADWDIKWAVENGISYFNYCWYRKDSNIGHPMTGKADQRRASALNDGMLNAIYRNQFHFTINWDNMTGGVSSPSDLLNNVLPYWTNTYFKNPNYLKVDNKPVLYVYNPTRLIEELGGVAATNTTLNQMRQSLQQQGFAGLQVIGMLASADPTYVNNLVNAGFDAQTDYQNRISTVWPTQQQAINEQVANVNTYNAAGIPFVPVASMGFDNRAWSSIQPRPLDPVKAQYWQLTPTNFQTLLGQEKQIMGTMAPGSLGSKMILLDTWNEWGEGHYIAPNQQSGFDYLKAVRNTFTAKDNTPNYLSPQQQGFGPYDSWYRNYFVGDARGMIYRDTFSRGSPGQPAILHYSQVESGQIDYGMWTAQRVLDAWTTDGTKALTKGDGHAFLPFTPAAGKVYTLSADIQTTGADSSKYMAFGFTNGDDLFNAWDTNIAVADRNAVAWWQKFAVTNSVSTFLGPDTNGGLSVSGGSSGFDNFSVVLDTTEEHWKVRWYLNGQLKRTGVYAANPEIAFVGMGGFAPGAVDNFSLTVLPEPSGIIIMATGLAALAAYAWRKQKSAVSSSVAHLEDAAAARSSNWV